METEDKFLAGMVVLAFLLFLSIVPLGSQETEIAIATDAYRENAKQYETISLTVGQPVPNFREFKPTDRPGIIELLRANNQDTLENRSLYFTTMDNLVAAQQELIKWCGLYEKGDWHLFYSRKPEYIEKCNLNKE